MSWEAKQDYCGLATGTKRGEETQVCPVWAE